MTETQAAKRLHKEFDNYQKEIAQYPNIKIAFYDSDIMVWYFVFYNLDDPYKGGEYLGEIKFPKDYPFSAPVIRMLTPNGRFQAEVNLCVNGISHYHNNNWSPMYKTPEVLVALLSFFYDDNDKFHVGFENSSKETKRILAKQSKTYNLKAFKIYRDLFNSSSDNEVPPEPPKENNLTEEDELQLALEQIAIMESQKKK